MNVVFESLEKEFSEKESVKIYKFGKIITIRFSYKLLINIFFTKEDTCIISQINFQEGVFFYLSKNDKYASKEISKKVVEVLERNDLKIISLKRREKI